MLSKGRKIAANEMITEIIPMTMKTALIQPGIPVGALIHFTEPAPHSGLL